MRMRTLTRLLGPLFAAGLLGACGSTPSMPDKAWTVEPVLAVNHSELDASGYYALGRQEEQVPPPDRALDAYRKAVELDPGFVPAWNALGTLQARLGQIDEALRALDRAVKLSPAASHLHNNLGYALLLAGRDEAAVASLQRAVEIDDGNRRAWRNLADAFRRLGDLDSAEDADAKANGTWVGKIRTPSAGAKAVPVRMEPLPEPLAVDASGAGSTLTVHGAAGAPLGVVRGPAAAPAIQAASARLVKLAENIYELRTGPAASDATPVLAATGAPAVPTPSAPPVPARAPAGAAPTVTIASATAPAMTVAPATVPAPQVQMASGAAAEPRSAVATASMAGVAPVVLRASATAEPVRAASTPAPAATPASGASEAVRYEVSNGHGRNGLARRIATRLHEDGMAFPRLTNQRPFNEPTTIVQYRSGFREAAEALIARLPFRPSIAAAPSAELGSDVRLLLGRDLSTSVACAELGLCATDVAGTTEPTLTADAGTYARPLD